MNIITKDLKTLWRSPGMWLVLAMLSFITAWILWQMIDQYVALQANFVLLPNPPNITQSIWVPFVLLLAKLMMLMVAFTSSYSIAQETAQQTLWYLQINQKHFVRMCLQKFVAQMSVLAYLVLMMTVVLWLLSKGGVLNWSQVTGGIMGLLMFVIWLIALGMLVSSFSQTPATAFLTSLVVYALLWMMGGVGVGAEYGLNWLHLLSPAQHLRWLSSGELSLSSLLYFGIGTIGFFSLVVKSLNPETR